MSWRNHLLNASFKDASFKVKSSDHGVGRRSQLHQFVNRKKGYWQDLGQDDDEFVIEGYIVQNKENEFDYFTERDALISALKSEGAGTLVHPYYGILKVGLDGMARISESFDEGGIATFQMTFRETGERVLPENIPDVINSVDIKANEMNDVVGDNFVLQYDVSTLFQNYPLTLFERNITSIKGIVSGMSGIVTRIINQTNRNLTAIRDSLLSIYSNPIDLFNAIKNSCYGIAVTTGMGVLLFKEQTETAGKAGVGFLSTEKKSIDIFAYLLDIDADITGGETGTYSGVTRGDVVTLKQDWVPEILGKSIIKNTLDAIINFDYSSFSITPENQQKNLCLLFDTFKFCLLNIICRIAIRTEFFSQDDLITYMNYIVDVINTVLLEFGAESANGSSANGIGIGTDPINNKDIFLSLQSMRNSFVTNMLLKAAGKAKAIDYSVPSDIQTTLELAYNRYKDLDRSYEIFYRNKTLMNHPGFMCCGETIRILDE